MKIRKNATRGYIPHSRLGEDNFKSYRSFDFEGYCSKGKYTNWGPIITINDDRADPGFITAYHEHKNLDILSYVVKGQVHHNDNMGNILQAQEGQVQHMSCGTGIWHTEGNSSAEPNRYLQIWVVPNKMQRDWEPRYTLLTRKPGFAKLETTFTNTELEVWAGNLDREFTVETHSYLLVLEGSCKIGDIQLDEGDAIDIDELSTISPIDTPHLLLFQLYY